MVFHYNRNTRNVVLAFSGAKLMLYTLVLYNLLVVLVTIPSRYFYRIHWYLFFSSAGKAGNVLHLTNFRRPSFGEDMNVKLIVKISALDFKQLYIFYKFYVIKRIYLSERIRYLAQTFNCSIQKHLVLQVFVCCFSKEKKMLKIFINCWK